MPAPPTVVAAAQGDYVRSHNHVPGRARRTGAVLAAAALLAGLMTWASPAAAAGIETVDLRIDSGTGADKVQLDVTLQIPNSATESEPAAAIIFPHGYGGTKEQPKGQATKFARQGYVALTYTARGFGDSTGDISLNAPDYEVADARTLIDLLSERPEVLQDGAGDPRVGILGGSYAGGLALLTAAYDQRVDVISASRTWNSLVNSLFPNGTGELAAQTPGASAANAGDGVFKKLWGQFFFEGGSLDAEGGEGGNGGGGGGQPAGECGGLREEYCTAYAEVLRTNRLTEDMRVLLEQSSPSSVIGQITAPTLLTQGEGDKLFPLAEADANARGIAANGTPVKLVWVTGGHGAFRQNAAEAAMLDALQTQWFDFHLRGAGADPGTSFDYTEVSDPILTGPMEGQPETVPSYPGLAGPGPARLEVPITGEAQELEYPAGGTPGALSSIPPGFTSQSGERRQLPTEIPEQTATFESQALIGPLDVVGSPTVDVQVASTSGEAVLFGKVYDVDATGGAVLVQSLVAPLRMTNLPSSLDQAQPTTIVLPTLAHSFGEGHSVRVILSSTDQGFATPEEAAQYQVKLADGETGVLSVPDVTGQPGPEFTPRAERALNLVLIAGAAAVGLIVVGVVVWLLLRRRSRVPSRRRVRSSSW